MAAAAACAALQQVVVRLTCDAAALDDAPSDAFEHSLQVLLS